MTATPVLEAPLVRLLARPIPRSLALATGIGVGLSLLGVFDTDGRPFIPRTWPIIAMLLAGMALAHVIRRFTSGFGWTSHRPIAHAVLVGVLLGPPMTLAIWVLEALITGFWHLPDLAAIFPAVTALCVGLGVSLSLVRRAIPAPRGVSTFADRLPPKLRGGEIWAIEAEDHYLRLHTSKGSDLVLMRFADALKELGGIEGEQVHRSWWVARTAIVSSEMEGRRAVLTLKNGAAAPVTRRRIPDLRSKGWFS